MKLGVPKEVHPGERRVAVTPDSVSKLKKNSASRSILNREPAKALGSLTMLTKVPVPPSSTGHALSGALPMSS